MDFSKKLCSIILSLLLLIPFIPTGYANGSAPSQWATQEIEEAITNQLVTTKVLSNYQQNITREEFAELAVKLYEALTNEKAISPSSNPFVDTNNPEILKAYSLGIVGGVAPNKFAPQLPITRQELSVMILRTVKAAVSYLDYNSANFSNTKFADESSIAPWALDAVKYLNYKGIVGGVGNNRINPKGNTTREMAIVLIQRSFKKFYKEPVTLVVGTAYLHRSLDPHFTNDLYSNRIMSQLYDTLLTLDESGDIAPGLAKSWKQLDSYTYEFVLKEDVKFHNGEILTAHDVAFTFKRASESYYIGHIIGNIDPDNIQVVNDHTIRIATIIPNASILHSFTHVSTSILNEKAVTEAGEVYGDHPVGTGPYKLESYKEYDGELILRAFRGYHGPKAKTDIVKMISMFGQQEKLLSSLEDGSIDMAFDVYASSTERLERNRNITLYRNLNHTVSYVGLNSADSVLKNIKLRQAINYAVDVDSIVAGAYGNAGTVATGPISPTVWGARPYLKQYDYNIDEAKKLLQEAGYPNGLKLRIAVNANPQREAIAEMMRQQLALINIELEINVLEWGNFLESISQGEYDLFVLGWTTVTGEADYSLYSLFHSSSHGFLGNYTFYSNEKVDELLDLARFANDPARRKQYYYEAQEIIMEEAPWVPIWFGDNISATKKGITGFTQHPMGYHKLATVEIHK